MNKYLIGALVAILSFGILFYVIENDKSMTEVVIGFILFILPTIFISSFKSNEAAFILVLSLCFYFYLGIYKGEYYDTLYGLALALVIGVPISSLRVEKYELFDQKEYKSSVEERVREKARQKDYKSSVEERARENARKRDWIFF